MNANVRAEVCPGGCDTEHRGSHAHGPFGTRENDSVKASSLMDA